MTTRGEWRIQVRLLPTWPQATGQPGRITVAVDDGAPTVLALPAYQNEKDPVWQEDVLRNTAIVKTSTVLSAGSHVLRIGALDPGVVLDSMLLLGPGATSFDDAGPSVAVVGAIAPSRDKNALYRAAK